jgi:hypothetical protein
MATDCEVLTPNARKIFEKLKPFFPPDPWKKPNWFEDGTVRDNGLFDLRKSQDRTRLIETSKSTLGSFVELQAIIYQKKNGTLEGFEVDHFGQMIKKEAELLLLLNDLDFQIETADLIDT